MAGKAPSKLVIGLVVDDTIDKPDGVQQYVQIVGRWLAQQGHTVYYLTGESHRTDIPNVHSLSKNVHVRFNGNRLSIPLPARRQQLRQLFRDVHFDVLHVMMPHSPFLAQRVVMAAPADTTVVGTFHILPHTRLAAHLSKVLGIWLHPSIKRMQAVVAVSPAAAVFAKRSFGITAEVLPNVIELNAFNGATPFERYRKYRTIVLVSRLVERKGCIHLLEAVALLQQQNRLPADVRLVICGKGPLLDKLRAFTAAHGLSEIVEFAGFVSEADKPRYIASADLAVYPSTSGESFGIVLLEAMAAAKGAVIAGDNPGYRSVMTIHEDQIVNPRDTARFADMIADFLAQPQRRKTATEWQRIAVRQYDVQQVGPKLERLYHDALRQRRNVR